MKWLFAVVAVFAVSQAFSIPDLHMDQWMSFKIEHGKKYESTEEDAKRSGIFKDNLIKIKEHNDRFQQGLEWFEAGINEFADMEHEEFVQTLNGYNKTARPNIEVHGATFIEPFNTNIPETMDWRDKGAVTPVKNQGQCGSCWAFSATGSLEGQHFRNSGKLVSLSEQNIMDCSKSYGTNSCEGGWMDLAFKYVHHNKGLDKEKYYPYLAEDEYSCNYEADESGTTEAGFVDIKAGSEAQLKTAVGTVGPVSVAMDAGHNSFQFYKSGVYYEPNCSTWLLDHGVLVVGYGVEDGQKYWLVKNSWGSSWGEKGYFKLARDRNNHCGVASKASYPLI